MTSYTLFSQAAPGVPLTSDATPYTFGVQFTVSQAGTLAAIWWFSGTGATSLPDHILLFQVTGSGTGTLVHSEAASWSGAVGTGWVRAQFSSPPSLTASTNYKASVSVAAVTGNWYTTTANYWSSGPGSGGITNGPLSAPNNAGGDGGQDTFSTSSLTYPATSFNAGNYWLDPEVSVAASGVANSFPGQRPRSIRPLFRAVTGFRRTGSGILAPFPGLGEPAVGGLVVPRRRDARRGGLWRSVYGQAPSGPPPGPLGHAVQLITGPVSTGWIAGPAGTSWQTGPVT